MATLDLDKILDNPNARVVIALPASATGIIGRKSIVGYSTSELSFGGAADYSNPLDSAKQKGLNDLLQSTQLSLGPLSKKLGLPEGFIPNISLKTVANSLSVWSSSSKPVFNVQMLFIATKPTDNVLNEVKKLLTTVYPTFSSVAGKGGLASVINPPLGYTPASASSAGGDSRNTIAVQIGQWFRAPFQIMKSVDHTFSKEVVENGSPLYAVVNISFEPNKAISASEAQDYISGV